MNVKLTRICTETTITSTKIATKDGKLVSVSMSRIHR